MYLDLKGNYYNGKYSLASIGGLKGVERSFEKYSPIDIKNHLWTCPIEYRHIEPVIQSAQNGFDSWKNITFTERLNTFKKVIKNIESKCDLISNSISLETGKPLEESKQEIQTLISKIESAKTHMLPRVEDKMVELDEKSRAYLYYRPSGITFIIGDAVLPVQVMGHQMISALLAGNSVILNPSLETCHSAQMLLDCFAEAGFPEGVINLIHGDKEMIRRLLSEKKIKVIFFTGSKEIGKSVMEAASQDLTKLISLGLGSKNFAILDKDLDIDKVSKELIDACFKTAGQRFTSTSVVAIHRSILNDFIRAFHALAKEISIDNPFSDKKPYMGPLLNKQSFDNYITYMGMAKREGLEEVMRGKVLEREPNGYYVSPSIHISERYNRNSHFLTNEIAGPNCTFIPFDTIEEAVSIVNECEFGLTASYFGKSKENQKYCIKNVLTGQLFINRATINTDIRLPFSGIKNSGNYRPGGVCAIDSCVYTQTVLINN